MLVVVEGRVLGGRDGEADAVGVLEARALGRLDGDGLREVEGEVLARLLLIREGHWRGAAARAAALSLAGASEVPVFLVSSKDSSSLFTDRLSSLPWTRHPPGLVCEASLGSSLPRVATRRRRQATDPCLALLSWVGAPHTPEQGRRGTSGRREADPPPLGALRGMARGTYGEGEWGVV